MMRSVHFLVMNYFFLQQQITMPGLQDYKELLTKASKKKSKEKVDTELRRLARGMKKDKSAP